MPFINLFDLYCSFMEGNDLRHSDLVTPITEYAKAAGKYSGPRFQDSGLSCALS